MPAITFKNKGDFSKTLRFFNKLLRRDYLNVAEKYAQKGLAALKDATPKESGRTSEAWNYIIESNSDTVKITYTNSNIVKGVNIAIILQYGHGTRNGGYVAGRDYINPAIQPIFDQIADEAWNEVISYE